MQTSRRRLLATAGLSLLAAASPRVRAQSAKASRIVVGFPPGGAPDVVARLLADRLRVILGQPFSVENKPGAAGMISVESVKNDPPDGRNLLFAPLPLLTLYPHTYREIRYNSFADFVPVASACTSTYGFAIGPMVPASVRTFSDFLAWARSSPKSASYGTPGLGTPHHFMGVMLTRATGIDLSHIPYKGGAQAFQDMMGGQVASLFTGFPLLVPAYRSGKLRILAMTGERRLGQFQEIPTFRELGFPDLEVADWLWLFAPSKTPDSMVEQIHRASAEAIHSREVAEAFAKLDVEPVALSRPEMAGVMKKDYEKWGRVISVSGFKAS